MPLHSHIISGHVYDIYGNNVDGATVVLTHTTGTLPATSSKGEYQFNLGKLSSWSIGNELSITANKTGEGSKTETVIVSSGGGQVVNITLAEEETVIGDVVSDMAKINKAMLVSYDKRDINRSNRLPVDTQEPLREYRPADQDTNAAVRYYGFVDRFGNWYIRKDDTTDRANTSFRYARGSSDYATNWTGRADIAYDRFDEVF